MRANAQTWENAVRTNALARREPYPPAKSAAPQMKTADHGVGSGREWTERTRRTRVTWLEMAALHKF